MRLEVIFLVKKQIKLEKNSIKRKLSIIFSKKKKKKKKKQKKKKQKKNIKKKKKKKKAKRQFNKYTKENVKEY